MRSKFKLKEIVRIKETNKLAMITNIHYEGNTYVYELAIPNSEGLDSSKYKENELLKSEVIN